MLVYSALRPEITILIFDCLSARNLSGALNTDWDQEGGGKNRLREAVDSFRLEGLTVKGVRLGSVWCVRYYT